MMLKLALPILGLDNLAMAQKLLEAVISNVTYTTVEFLKKPLEEMAIDSAWMVGLVGVARFLYKAQKKLPEQPRKAVLAARASMLALAGGAVVSAYNIAGTTSNYINIPAERTSFFIENYSAHPPDEATAGDITTS